MIYDAFVPQAVKMLGNLKAVLAKGEAYAETKKFDSSVLLNSRLAPDQFPLLKQVQIVTDTAKLCGQRLSGKEAMKHDDQEKTFADLNTRIDQVVGYLQSLKAADFEGAEKKEISQPRWEGKYLTGYEFLIQHAIPNLYFHTTTAYSILRHNGVEVGKKDYLGAMPFKGGK